MLRFILGRNGSGKTEYVRQMLSERLCAGETGLILVVPEQFSFETEREMLKRVGAKNMLHLEILSFTRLAHTVLSAAGKLSKPQITDGMRAVLMSLSLEALEDKLEIYQKYKNRAALLGSLVTFSTELKQCAVSPEALTSAGEALPNGILKEKLTELSLITQMYNAAVAVRFSDDTDLLTLLTEEIFASDYFDGKTVVFDTFAGFTKQERNVIAALLPRCKDVYITLCTEAVKNVQNACVFDNIDDEYTKLKAVAAKANVPVANPTVLHAPKGQKPESLAFLEENLYNCRKPKFTGTQTEIKLTSASNRTEECDLTARAIRRLLRTEGYRASEIAVLQRRKNTYDSALAAAFHKYEIPFFEDKRRPVATQPLMLFMSSLLDILADGITTESLLRCLKTGLFGLSDEETAELENYVTVWGIDRTAWRTDFTENPNGLGTAMQTRDEQKLEILNGLRRRVAEPMLALRKVFSEQSGTQKSESLYHFLRRSGVDTALRTLAENLASAGYTEAAAQQDAVWESLMGILDDLSGAVAERTVSAARYRELFSVLLENTDLGQIPEGLDAVCFGTADRVRIAPPRAVFLLGMNDGVFPENPPTDGVLNDTDRKALHTLGLELTETAEVKAVDERFFVYYALTLARERVCLSWAMSDYKGGAMAESPVVSEIRAMFPEIAVEDSNTLSAESRVESADSAFEALASVYGENTVLSETLKSYFSQKSDYCARLAALEQAVNGGETAFRNPETAKRLFGENILLSASKTEAYYKCPFSYFCKFGLRLKPLKKAELDVAQSGTVIHYCLEMLLSENDRDTLAQMSDNTLREKIAEVTARYIQENMGGAEGKDARFSYLLERLQVSVFDVLKRLISEFSVSAFVPVAFELSVAPDGEIAPYRLPLPDGGSVRIIGSVDRVDTMQKDGKTYLRVIDYKSGGKAFNLSEVFSGLNMQMLIYLYAICENGTERFGEIVPAGVLYLPAKSIEDKLPRNAQSQDISEARLRNSRMHGVVLDNTDAILGMDSTVSGNFIPVTAGKNGAFTGKLLTAQEFSALKEKVDGNLTDLGTLLHGGVIPVLPAHSGNQNMACTYCDYAAVCGYENGDATRQIVNLGRFDAVKKQLQTEKGGQDE